MSFPSLYRLVAGLVGIRRRWWLVGLVLLLSASGGWIWLRPEPAAQTQSVTQTVSRGTYKSTVTATGTITPVKEADLSFSSSGTVTAVAVSVGDSVRKGDILAKIDATALLAQRDAAQAQVSAARTQLSEDSGGSSTQVSADRAALAAARSQLAQAEKAVDEATLTAPFSGTVSAVGVDVGDQSGSSQNQPTSSGSGSTAAISLITPKRLLVEANVSANDVSSLKKGLQAEITPTGGGEVAYGVVSDVGVIAGASDTGAAQFPVTIEVTGKPTGLYPGSSATVAVTVKQANDVLTVPTQALHTENGETFVYVVEGDRRTKTVVTLGESYGMQTEVLSGLTEGVTVELMSFSRPRGSGTGGNGGSGDGGFPLPPGGAEIRLPAGGGQGPVFQSGP